MNDNRFNRRDFIRHGTQTAGLLGLAHAANAWADRPPGPEQELVAGLPSESRTSFDGHYEGAALSEIAFPMGGMGAGMICLEGAGALSHVSLRHRPEMNHEPALFAAVSVKGPKAIARVLEGPVPLRKRRADFSLTRVNETSARWGLPRFRQADFTARFPFGRINLIDETVPLIVSVTGWSPFEPGDADNASLPVAGLEYAFTNRGADSVEAVFSFHASNFMAENGASGATQGAEAQDRVDSMRGGFQLHGAGAATTPWDAGAFAAWVDDPAAKVNAGWFRGSEWDGLVMAWRDVERAACYERPAPPEGAASPGASLFVPFHLAPGESRTITVCLAWFVRRSNLNRPGGMATLIWEDDPVRHAATDAYQPWYAGRFAGIDAVADYWRTHYVELRRNTARFSDAFYDSTLPPEVIEAVAANLSILKSSTVLRQADGRFWGWEGSANDFGSCEGTCTHVWNYAQALPHLFPALERSLRETEFGPNQREDGHQDFRAALPIRPTPHNFYAAADGQLGGIMKVHREWRISGDTQWLRGLWPKVRASLDYCIRTWDPAHRGWVEEPHHNTYDIEFWGPDSLCASIYLGALRAAVLMGEALGERVDLYAQLLKAGVHRAETELFNGEYFVQKVQWQNLRAHFPEDSHGLFGAYSAEGLALAKQEGPRYQYGEGCLADGVVGAWLAGVCGVGPVLDAGKVQRHLLAVHRHNLKENLAAHSNPASAWRSRFGFGNEGGLLLCTWPKGGELSLPFIYSSEVWTGIEYQVASHLMMHGKVAEGLQIVRSCRERYDGRWRNPFSEVEAGHWYARAMSSYALLEGLSGARYDAVDQVLHLQPSLRGDFRSFLSTATGYGTVGVRNGAPFVEVVAGEIPFKAIAYVAVLGPTGCAALS